MHLPGLCPTRLIINTAAACSLLIFADWPCWSAKAQTTTYAGAVDAGFTPPTGLAGNLDDSFNPAGSVRATALQADGKLLVVGSQIRGIDRLLPNGQADPTFTVGVGTDAEISTVAYQADGSILIGGGFTTVSGSAAPYLTHIMPNGTIDATYAPQLNGPVRALTMLSTGQVAVGGEFTMVNGNLATSRLARLNSDGTADAAFSTAGTDGPVYSIAEQPDGSGRLLVGGAFNHIGGTQSANLGQVMADGTADATFNPGTLAATGTKGTDGTVQVVKFLKDGSGRALVGGSFSNVGAVAQPALVQVLPGGAADLSFRPGGTAAAQPARRGQSAAASGISNGGKPATVYSLDLQRDGSVIIGGAFAQIAATVQNSMARLLPDGRVDPQFTTGSGANASVRAVLVQPDQQAVVAGSFTRINNASLGGVGRLTANASAPAFFDGGVAVGDGFYYLTFPDGTLFGYFNLVGDGYSFPYFYHSDLGQEFFFDANDGQNGAYLYDFTSRTFFYTSPSFPFPYLYDFSLDSVLYYYPDTNNPGHYTSNPRYFFDYATNKIITK